MPIQGLSAKRARPWLPSGRAFGATFCPHLRRYLLPAPSALLLSHRAFGATSADDVNRDELLPGDYKLSRRQLHLKYR
jgi:hypothetical protein